MKWDTNRSFLQNTSIYLSATVITTAITFITLPIYTRYLSPADFGILALFLMLGTVCASILSIGLQSASYRYYFKLKKNPEEYKIYNSTNLIFLCTVFLLAGLGIYRFANWISAALLNNTITGYIVTLSFLFGCLQYLFSYLTLLLTAQIKSVQFFVVNISLAILNATFSFYFIFMHSLTYMARIYATLLALGIQVIVLLFLTRSLLGIYFSLKTLKKSILFSYPLLPRTIIGVIGDSVGKILLANYSGLSSLGYYSFGQKFAHLIKIANESTSKMWGPFFMNKAQENTNEGKRSIVQRFNAIFFIIMLAGLSIIYFSEELIKIFTTKEFYPSMYVTPIYVYLYLFGLMGMISINQMLFAEKLLYMLPATIIGVTLNVILSLLLIPKFSEIGAAFAAAISAFGTNAIHLYFGLKAYPLPIGKLKFAGLYLLIIAFTVPIYPIIGMDLNYILKIIIKGVLLLAFIGFGFSLNFISKEYLNKWLYRFQIKANG